MEPQELRLMLKDLESDLIEGKHPYLIRIA